MLLELACFGNWRILESELDIGGFGLIRLCLTCAWSVQHRAGSAYLLSKYN
ncbi:hypothetical protein T01_15383 [Trichinella spiralis]|uniref:Uncharacterized protein n=1 Tax=Trichinella spiralis TaxID=6334 RepID=A0A0V1B235_TRISP|nr:hypothetical protein T01_15383 [Trichinella spiralis]